MAGTADSEKKTVIRNLILNTSPSFSDQRIHYVAQQAYNVYLAVNPDLPPRAYQIVFEETKRDYMRLLDQIIPVYERYFTLPELRSIAAFYDTEVGRKMIRVTPQIQQEAASLQSRGELTTQNISALYEKHFTQDEHQRIMAFNNTEIGRKLTRVEPQLTEEQNQVTQAWLKKSPGEVQKKIDRRYQKEGIEIIPK